MGDSFSEIGSVFPIDYKRNRRACGNVGIAQRFPKDGGKGGNPGVGFPGFPRVRHFQMLLLVATCPQLSFDSGAQFAVKDMPECIEKADEDRSVQYLEVALIEWTQADPLIGESLAEKGALTLPLQTALL